MISTVYVLIARPGHKPTKVFHGPVCRCLIEHDPYGPMTRTMAVARGLLPCGYCGGK